MLKQTLLITLIVLMSCKNSQQAPQEAPDVRDVIVEKLGSKFEKIDRGELSLCYTTDKKTLTNWRTVLVINTETSTILYGPEKLNAKVSWYADRKLLIKETPEVINDKQSSDTYTYIFNLDTNQKESNTP